jgi:hypothetical protein
MNEEQSEVLKSVRNVIIRKTFQNQKIEHFTSIEMKIMLKQKISQLPKIVALANAVFNSPNQSSKMQN